jgi:hypothetical protein
MDDAVNAENRNHDRSQCKPLHHRNSNLLMDSAACSCLCPPQRKNYSSAMSFSTASHTTYSILGISLSCAICLQGDWEGEWE